MKLVANGAGGGERVQALIEPAKQGFLSGARQIGRVDMNVSALADPIQTADALFQQIRMEREIEAYEVLCKLKIAALTANFRADQRLRTTAFLGKVRGSAVSLDQAQILVKAAQLTPALRCKKCSSDIAVSLWAQITSTFLGRRSFNCFSSHSTGVLFNPARFRVQCLRMQ